jgi:CheY-like chemotaxis protein
LAGITIVNGYVWQTCYKNWMDHQSYILPTTQNLDHSAAPHRSLSAAAETIDSHLRRLEIGLWGQRRTDMSKFKVLCVDDDMVIREVAMMSLEDDPDIDARSESSGGAALITAAQWEPDAILLDVKMPAMDGLATLAHLRGNAATAAIPVILLTGAAQPADLVRYIELGIIDVIPKPFDPTKLATLVRGMVGR